MCSCTDAANSHQFGPRYRTRAPIIPGLSSGDPSAADNVPMVVYCGLTLDQSASARCGSCATDAVVRSLGDRWHAAPFACPAYFMTRPAMPGSWLFAQRCGLRGTPQTMRIILTRSQSYA